MILHGIGKTFIGALEQTCLAMFNVFTPLEVIEQLNQREEIIHVEDAEDKYDFVYHVLDELLFVFCTEFFVAKQVSIENVIQDENGHFSASIRIFGETFVLGKHEQGTEIKAVTMHNMRIFETPEETNILVTVDI